jgi:UDP-N-acetylglucosamine 1-carboxyvinyltransferase
MALSELAFPAPPPGREQEDCVTIVGGAPLHGSIAISGAKNSALKLMAASLLTDQPLKLKNMPRLADTRFLGELLRRLGVEVREVEGADGMETHLHSAEITSAFASSGMVRQMRASFNVLGPLLARTGHAKVSLPGGCTIGVRPVDLHLKAFRAMGARIALHEGYVYAQAPRGLRGAEIAFPFVSVGATEHTMLAATLARGVTIIRNAACEPEIGDLAKCLNAMGAKVEGAGTATVTIVGVESLRGAIHPVIPDRIETGSYAMAVAMAGGAVTLTGTRGELVQPLLEKLRAAGVEIDLRADGIVVRRGSNRLQAVDFETNPFPGFPTDLQAQFMALMTTAKGISRVRENIFENRFMHVPELARLGADIRVRGREAHITGVEGLRGARVTATDLRASVGLVIAALAADGETVISSPQHLDRGFDGLEGKLARCGAQVWRMAGKQLV